MGISAEAALDQQTLNVCLDEIRRCQREQPAATPQPRPNFIVLLGDRYGWCPPPPEIPADELEALRPRIPEDARALVDDWYRLDTNATPSEYVLAPRDEDPYRDDDAWAPVEGQLHDTLLLAARAAKPRPDMLRYEASVTEQEIVLGALGQPDAHEHVFGFFRTITGLPRDARGATFLDLEAKEPESAAQRLADLKEKVEDHLPGHLDHYEAHWVEGPVDNVNAYGELATNHVTDAHIGSLPDDLDACLALAEEADRDHPDSPTTLCLDVFRRLAAVIQAEVERLGIDETSSLEREIEAHRAFGRDRAPTDRFVGRGDILATVDAYVDNPQARPLVLWGESGSGKSAVVARAAQLAEARYGDAVVVRYIGTTPELSDIRSLLTSICTQLRGRYATESEVVPADYRDLVREFRLALTAATAPLVLFLDALDQLSDTERARNLIWLPIGDLAPDVRVIVSTMPGECLDVLRRRVPDGHRTEIGHLPRDDAKLLLAQWLGDAHRTLTDAQEHEVLASFDPQGDGGKPLYLRLAFEEARRWKSYADGSETQLSDEGIPGVIEKNLLRRLALEEQHGAVMVSRSLGYLAAGKEGLSEDELLDVLSRDDVVLADFRRRAPNSPPVDALPPIVWSRLYHDLAPYLTERQTDGGALLAFYHRQLREAAERLFLDETERANRREGEARTERAERHAHLASYYSGQENEATLGGETTPNRRRLVELPYQQTKAELWDDVFATLTDFDFLEAKCTHVGAVDVTNASGNPSTLYMGVYLLQDDYALALRDMPGGDREGSDDRRRIIITGVDFRDGNGFVIRCPHCNTASPFDDAYRGKDISCPNDKCKGPLRVNKFIVGESALDMA